MRKKGIDTPSEHKHSRKMSSKPSIKEPVIAEKISRKFNMPEDIIAGAPILTGYGSHIFCVENYKSIIEYTSNIVRIQTKLGRIHIVGKNLVIAYFRDDAMCILGDINSIEYH